MPDGPRLRPEIHDLPEYRAGRRAPEGAYKLSSNENPFPPLPAVEAALADAAGEANRYPELTSARLVAAIARKHGVTEDEVAVGTGSVAIADQLVRICATAGDEVVFAWRSFESYPIVTGIAGATAVRVPLRNDESHDLPRMADAVTERTRLVFVCTPNNPTGAACRSDELERFLDRVPSDVLVVLDEAYREFVRDPDVPDGIAVARGRPNVVVLRTFSKAHGLAGLRVGYGVGSTDVVRALRKVAVPFGVSTAAEYAALAALGAEDEVRRRVDAVVAERDRVTEQLRVLGVAVEPSQANFVWLRLGERTSAFASTCEAHGVVVRPFSGEGVRVTVGEREANERFLAAAATLV